MHGFTTYVLLALLAAYSCEAALTTYEAVGDTGPKITVNVFAADKDGNKKMVTENGVNREVDVKCSVADFENGDCLNDLNWDDKDFIHYDFTVPADFALTGAAADLTPKEWVVRLCFAAVSQKDRPWRKSKPEFKKDKRCKYSTTVPHVPGQAEYVALKEVKSDTPQALFTVDLFHRCEGQGSNEYCYIARGNDTYATVAMESRPTVLWVFALLCGALGPLLYFGSLLYERVLKKDS